MSATNVSRESWGALVPAQAVILDTGPAEDGAGMAGIGTKMR